MAQHRRKAAELLVVEQEHRNARGGIAKRGRDIRCKIGERREDAKQNERDRLRVSKQEQRSKAIWELVRYEDRVADYFREQRYNYERAARYPWERIAPDPLPP